MPCESKIGDFYVQTVVEENVLRLQVSVDDISRVNIVDTFENLPHDVAGLLLWQRNDGSQVIEKLSMTTKLKHQEDESVRLKDVLKLN